MCTYLYLIKASFLQLYKLLHLLTENVCDWSRYLIYHQQIYKIFNISLGVWTILNILWDISYPKRHNISWFFFFTNVKLLSYKPKPKYTQHFVSISLCSYLIYFFCSLILIYFFNIKVISYPAQLILPLKISVLTINTFRGHTIVLSNTKISKLNNISKPNNNWNVIIKILFLCFSKFPSFLSLCSHNNKSTQLKQT